MFLEYFELGGDLGTRSKTTFWIKNLSHNEIWIAISLQYKKPSKTFFKWNELELINDDRAITGGLINLKPGEEQSFTQLPDYLYHLIEYRIVEYLDDEENKSKSTNKNQESNNEQNNKSNNQQPNNQQPNNQQPNNQQPNNQQLNNDLETKRQKEINNILNDYYNQISANKKAEDILKQGISTLSNIINNSKKEDSINNSKSTSATSYEVNNNNSNFSNNKPNDSLNQTQLLEKIIALQQLKIKQLQIDSQQRHLNNEQKLIDSIINNFSENTKANSLITKNSNEKINKNENNYGYKDFIISFQGLHLGIGVSYEYYSGNYYGFGSAVGITGIDILHQRVHFKKSLQGSNIGLVYGLTWLPILVDAEGKSKIFNHLMYTYEYRSKNNLCFSIGFGTLFPSKINHREDFNPWFRTSFGFTIK
jgi:hypothetical protein